MFFIEMVFCERKFVKKKNYFFNWEAIIWWILVCFHLLEVGNLTNERNNNNTQKKKSKNYLWKVNNDSQENHSHSHSVHCYENYAECILNKVEVERKGNNRLNLNTECMWNECIRNIVCTCAILCVTGNYFATMSTNGI